MKGIFLFSSRLRVYIIEIPLILLLVLAIRFNDNVESLLKLYPLQVCLILGIAFVGVYFFRGILIKFDEVRDVGLFSERDKAVINKDKTLILTLMKKGKIKVELYGNDGTVAGYDWLRADESKPNDIFLYRGKANGNKKAAKRILRYFDVFENDFDRIFNEDSFTFEYENVLLSSSIVNERREIRLKFKETI